ncbi:MAG: dCTP deaminase [Candidatus Diapherotrites archaeon]|nr:dCTP deaminase [Candidatus Diapherotrites archaeon]
MLITGRTLRSIAESLSEDKLHVGTSSIDVRLGNKFYIGDSQSSEIIIAEDGVVEYRGFEYVEKEHGEVFTFEPGKLYIAESKEYIRIPGNMGAFLALRSSAGRRGLDHLHAGWLEPGWEGYITFELNAIVRTQFRIGERIAQLVFIRADEWTQYAGQYQKQTGPVLAGVRAA